MKNKFFIPILVATICLVLFQGFFFLAVPAKDPSHLTYLQEEIQELQSAIEEYETKAEELNQRLMVLNSEPEPSRQEMSEIHAEYDLYQEMQYEAQNMLWDTEFEFEQYQRDLEKDRITILLVAILGGVASWVVPFILVLLIRRLKASGSSSYRNRRIWNIVALCFFLLGLLISFTENQEAQAIAFAILAGAEIVVLGLTAKNKDDDSKDENPNASNS